MHTFAIVLLLQASQLLTPCRSQTVADDDQTWNKFFRGMRSTPQFPYPGTLNNHEWDQYRQGFAPSLWDTKDFTSIIRLTPDYAPGHMVPHHLIQKTLWENYWEFFDIFVFSSSSTVNLQNAGRLWEYYIQMLRDMYCCQSKDTLTAEFTYGCSSGLLLNTDLNDCCRPEKLLSTCKDIGQKFIRDWSVQSIQSLKFKFYYWLCIVYFDRLMYLTPEWNTICPDPCNGDPCSEISNAIARSCVREPFPLDKYQNEFKCSCLTNYFFDKYTRQCLLRPLCASKLCNATGTEACIDLTQGYECKCKQDFTGAKCSTPVNPCLKRRRPTNIAGNIACQSALGNRCDPQYGRDTFVCECFPPYSREVDPHKVAATFRRSAELSPDGISIAGTVDELLPPDNCLSKHDACDKIICGGADGRGRCMPSGNLLNFICVCDKNEDGYPLYEGKYCETPVSQWSDWSHWSLCRPECGESCFQSRQRLCRHLDGRAYCKGTDEELRHCEPACRPCPNRSFAHLSGVFVKETSAPLLLAVVTLFLAQLLALAVLEWVFSPDVMRPI